MANVTETLAKLKEAKTTLLTKVEDYRYNATNPYVFSGKAFNNLDIPTCNSVELLKVGLSDMLKAFSELSVADEYLGVDSVNKVQGLTKEQWGEDFKHRYLTLTAEKKARDLDAAITQVSKHLSDDDKANIAVEAAGKLLEMLNL